MKNSLSTCLLLSIFILTSCFEQKKKDPQNEKKEQKPQPGKMSPQQIKQLLESLKNEEKKTQKKLNAQQAKGKKIKQEKNYVFGKRHHFNLGIRILIFICIFDVFR